MGTANAGHKAKSQKRRRTLHRAAEHVQFVVFNDTKLKQNIEVIETELKLVSEALLCTKTYRLCKGCVTCQYRTSVWFSEDI